MRRPKQIIGYVRCLPVCILTLGFWGCAPSESDRAPAAIEQVAQVAQDSRAPQDPADTLQATTLPDFTSIKDTEQRKRRFFEFMRPLVHAENERIRGLRSQIRRLYDTLMEGQELSAHNRVWLQELCEAYRVSSADPSYEEMIRQLLIHVDTVPLELALAQAANESAWGRSKFARTGNNIFGERCVAEGCGIVPRRRATGEMHEVTTFDLPTHSVRSYIHNLNSHPAYHPFRILRHEKRQADERPDGYTLVHGLQEYSEAGMDYVHRIRAIIRQNRDLIPVPE